MIDMHLHTYYSDGTMSPSDIVKRALDKGVRTLAITDHDGLYGIEEAISAGKLYGVTVIPGIELSTIMTLGELGLKKNIEDGIVNMHILGYEIDIHDEGLNKAVKEIRRKREERNRRLLTALNRIGLNIEEKDLLQRKDQNYVGKPNFALALKKKGYIQTTGEANTPGKFLRHPEARSIHREKIHVRKAIDLIKNAGGYSVLAHPLKVRFPCYEGAEKYDLLDILLEKLIKWGLSGMECYYSSHNSEQIEKLVSLAKSRDMVITAGSDFHSPDFDPKVEIGQVEKEHK